MVVQTDQSYDYARMTSDIATLQEQYDGIDAFSLGSSVAGRDIWCLRIGNGANRVLYHGAHHALEWITALLLVKFCELCLDAGRHGVRLAGYDVGTVLTKTSIYLVPMVNPDGVDLVLNGIRPDDPRYDALVSYNHGSVDFSKTWQANLNGVDLNHNYDADFHRSRDAEAALGIFGPNNTRYAGTRPFSEPETRALAQFVSQANLRLAAAYHSQGRVIYYGFRGKEPQEAHAIASRLAQETGYQLDVPDGIASFGGFTDWFTDQYRRPAYTVEVGLGKNPLPLSQFNRILQENLAALLLLAMA